jgi:hypothetical protein
MRGNGKNEAEGEDCVGRMSEHPPGWRVQERSQAGRRPVLGHHRFGEAESSQAAAVSLTGTHDRCPEAGAVHRWTADQPIVRWLARLQAHTTKVGAEMADGPQLKAQCVAREPHRRSTLYRN